MRIAMILPSLSKTGPGIVVYDLCTEYIKLGHECKVFYFDEINGIEMPCPVERIKFNQVIDFDSWDVIHSHMLRPNAYIWYHKSKIHKALTITTLHNPITYKAARTGFGFLYSFIVPIFWRKFIEAHNWIVSLNANTMEELPSKIKDKSSIIFNGRNIDIKPLSHQSPIIENIKLLKDNRKVIGTISSLTKRKGLDQAIHGLKSLPDYILVIIGEGPERKNLEKLAENLEIKDRVYFLGFQNNPTMFLPYIDVFIMCSESEGFPLALIEAAACGNPAVLSNIPILQSIISEKNGVKFYQLYDIKDLTKCVTDAYKLRAKMGQEIYKYYKNSLTAEIMANNYIALYKWIKERSEVK